jgi:hypothetical protein
MVRHGWRVLEGTRSGSGLCPKRGSARYGTALVNEHGPRGEVSLVWNSVMDDSSCPGVACPSGKG